MNIAEALERHHTAFRTVFPSPRYGYFGHHRQGIHDGKEGVQWNAGVEIDHDPVTGWVGVNLEGLKYDDWPIARLIERELGSFALFRVMANFDQPEEITVRWSRDAWPRQTAPYDQYLIDRFPLTELTRPRWQIDLVEAQGCLDHKRGFHGRVRQEITREGNTFFLDVSPHLQLVRELWRDDPPLEPVLIKLMQEAHRQLLPIHRMIGDLSKAANVTLADAQRDIDAKETEERNEEGGKSLVLVNVCERSADNRRKAIEIHGTRCQACGFSFEEVYGERGRNYIEVHHLRSIASYGGAVQVDPGADMAVLCSNCHSMVHRRKDNPLTPEGLRTILRK